MSKKCPSKRGHKCPDCGAAMVERRGAYGQFWGCTKFPECKGTFSGMGTPGNAETRRLRIEAHELFDVLWQDDHMTRGEAYEWLQDAMGLAPKDCHIARMTLSQCQRVIDLAAAKLADFMEGDPDEPQF